MLENVSIDTKHQTSLYTSTNVPYLLSRKERPSSYSRYGLRNTRRSAVPLGTIAGEVGLLHAGYAHRQQQHCSSVGTRRLQLKHSLQRTRQIAAHAP